MKLHQEGSSSSGNEARERVLGLFLEVKGEQQLLISFKIAWDMAKHFQTVLLLLFWQG